MSRNRQSGLLFVIFALLGGLLFLGVGIVMIVMTVGDSSASVLLPVGIVFSLLGVGLGIGGVWGVRTFGNANAGKSDKDAVISYRMEEDGVVSKLENAEQLRAALRKLTGDKEITITLSPEFFGLTSWKIKCKKGFFVSFVTIHKKDKFVEYFVMPNRIIDEAIEPFLHVFEEKKAVNTSNLIEMKRYQAVMEYYKL